MRVLFFEGTNMKNMIDVLAADTFFIRSFFDIRGFTATTITKPVINFREEFLRGKGDAPNGSMHFRGTDVQNLTHRISIVWDQKEAVVVGYSFADNFGPLMTGELDKRSYQSFREAVMDAGNEGIDAYLSDLRERLDLSLQYRRIMAILVEQGFKGLDSRVVGMALTNYMSSQTEESRVLRGIDFVRKSEDGKTMVDMIGLCLIREENGREAAYVAYEAWDLSKPPEASYPKHLNAQDFLSRVEQGADVIEAFSNLPRTVLHSPPRKDKSLRPYVH